ncbi:hypothetical protein THAOC_27624 [Thalassiosira oceanica]|uniref:Uncharacterized protein n=1 Tax=Thalassiosira oceanica TaxID=159749 RepID=K0RVY9_THAOC|nr:hypothetical protein THAOC_27624 [Thalassiosira oceanica]|eukprot:EJK53011.1 hypothetical protein THAOC_27624 [Thalassiosira oceanica]
MLCLSLRCSSLYDSSGSSRTHAPQIFMMEIDRFPPTLVVCHVESRLRRRESQQATGARCLRLRRLHIAVALALAVLAEERQQCSQRQPRATWGSSACLTVCLSCSTTDDDDDDDTSNGRDRGRRQRQRLRLGCAEPAPSPFARSDDAPSGASPGVLGRPREEPEGESWRGKWRRPAQKCQRRRGMQMNSAHKGRGGRLLNARQVPASVGVGGRLVDCRGHLSDDAADASFPESCLWERGDRRGSVQGRTQSLLPGQPRPERSSRARSFVLFGHHCAIAILRPFWRRLRLSFAPMNARVHAGKEGRLGGLEECPGQLTTGRGWLDGAVPAASDPPVEELEDLVLTRRPGPTTATTWTRTTSDRSSLRYSTGTTVREATPRPTAGESRPSRRRPRPIVGVVKAQQQVATGRPCGRPARGLATISECPPAAPGRLLGDDRGAPPAVQGVPRGM